MNYLDIVDDYIGLDYLGDFDSILTTLSPKDTESLLNFCQNVSAVLPRPRQATSPFHFIANSAQSGLPHPCAQPECRQEKLTQLIAYSSIYADHVAIVDHFSYIADIYSNKSAPESVRLDCAIAISLLIATHPLIERGIVTFYDFSGTHLCAECYEKAILSYIDSGETKDIYFRVLKEFAERTQVTLEQTSDGDFYFKIAGAEDFIDHGAVYHHGTNIDADHYKLHSLLTKEDALRLGVFDNMAQFVKNDLIQKSYVADTYGISKIFSSQPEIGVLSSLFDQSFAGQQFSVDIPFLTSRNSREILKLRDDEWHHFEDFRAHFEKVSREHEGGNAGNPDLVRQEIESELINIEKIFKRFSRETNRALIDGAAVSIMSLGASVLTAGVSTYLSATAALIGGRHFTKSMIPTLRKKFDEPESLRDSRMYYLWKVRKSLDL